MTEPHNRQMTPRQQVKRKWPRAVVIKGRDFQNAPDEFTYISTRHQVGLNGLRGGRLIGRGKNAREAWADAAARVRAESVRRRLDRRGAR